MQTKLPRPPIRASGTQLLAFKSLPRISPSFRRCYSVVTNRTYDDTVELLNTLQTPYSVLKYRRDNGIRIDKTANEEIVRCLEKIGYNQNDLSRLNILHVAGTKGKGSTCAYISSILAQHQKTTSPAIPQKIGLFTSPHLIAVRERIRISSLPIPAPLFAKYFFQVWNMLSSPPNALPKPVYFRFLTLLSYHVFLSEQVDAAIYEVGVGGEYDSTNIVQRPVATGITTLGIDHTFALGETIEEIAWHKAGIQKFGTPSFTVPQRGGAMNVIQSRAEERGVEYLKVVEQDLRLEGVKVKPDADFQKGNASLAIAMAEILLRKIDPEFEVDSMKLPKAFKDGIEQVVWRGRCEKKVEESVTWYLDGAHTSDSIAVASKWFSEETDKKKVTRVLIFNQQGHREAVELLEHLYHAINKHNVVFDHVVFCPTVLLPSSSTKKDFMNAANDTQAITSLSLQNTFAKKWKELSSLSPPSTTKMNTQPTRINVFSSLDDAFKYVRSLPRTENEGKEPKEENEKVEVFVTGSVHLVGTALGSLEGVDAL
ncbi:hypothetical protein HYFRA_00005008 [Hymenoscyphus fraxineus]|uniref:Folylpolyglutamate synthase n=1 Tax=Hymenoscyphus fraxineus TaxID=746836 RepID=A0A9N9KLW8_9HELO|nr:hypothetical protein HYFRA_00005008 [Hymenoscyphus fraxineus]